MAIITESKLEHASESHRPFLDFIARWQEALPSLDFSTLIQDAGGAEGIALIAVDLVKGFTTRGPLASKRIAAVVPRVRQLMRRGHDEGVRGFLFLNDSHPPDSPEFQCWPCHCVAGSEESELDGSLATLPFAHQFQVFEKRSLDGALGTGLLPWLEQHPEVTRLVITGDCTDLCVYELAMHLHLRATVEGRPWQVIVPATCVETYDLPVPVAQAVGAMPHDGPLLQRIFLYQMALNGIRVVRDIR